MDYETWIRATVAIGGGRELSEACLQAIEAYKDAKLAVANYSETLGQQEAVLIRLWGKYEARNRALQAAWLRHHAP